jgi:hypothetical protein
LMSRSIERPFAIQMQAEVMIEGLQNNRWIIEKFRKNRWDLVT